MGKSRINRWWSPSELETEIRSGTWAKRFYLWRLLSSCRAPLTRSVDSLPLYIPCSRRWRGGRGCVRVNPKYRRGGAVCRGTAAAMDAPPPARVRVNPNIINNNLKGWPDSWLLRPGVGGRGAYRRGGAFYRATAAAMDAPPPAAAGDAGGRSIAVCAGAGCYYA